MSASYAILITLGACVIAAALEGACAGKHVKSYFAKLQFPPYSAPLWVWYIIGGLYYTIFFFVIYRILRQSSESALRNVTIPLIFFMMIVNALWNYIFFRAQNLFLSFIIASLFPIMDIALFICLIQLDKTAAWSLVPYLLYRLYALWWGYGLWKINDRAA
ncbi:MAG: TspO/MBR family protein [Pyrinomonadaceae bacterium]